MAGASPCSTAAACASSATWREYPANHGNFKSMTSPTKVNGMSGGLFIALFDTFCAEMSAGAVKADGGRLTGNEVAGEIGSDAPESGSANQSRAKRLAKRTSSS